MPICAVLLLLVLPYRTNTTLVCIKIIIFVQVRGDQIGLFKLVTLNCILNRITGVTFGC
jgi:hypothetical protein